MSGPGVFSRIYRENLWAGEESRSGPGSGYGATGPVAAELVALAAELGVRSTLDVACGDGLWMPELPGYLGIDVAAEAITLARRHHPERHYRVGDVRLGGWPRADLVILRDALQHLPLEDGLAVLWAIARMGSTWLLASTFRGGANEDVPAGGAYSPDLEAPPFNLWPPERLIFDGYDYAGEGLPRDPRKHLGLWRLGATLPL